MLFLARGLSFHLKIALILRLVLLIWSVYQDSNFKVKFTDVDYHVFNEASQAVINGESPYIRHTYRYSPLLAFLLAPGWWFNIQAYFGKILFILCDLLCGVLCHRIVNSADRKTQYAEHSYLLWLYNPITLAVSVRGNAESFVALPILASLHFLERKTAKSDVLSAALIATAIHLKIYPVIYALTFLLAIIGRDKQQSSIFSVPVARYGITAGVVLLFWNGLFYKLYGDEYLEHSLFYHFKRTDIRHNFSLWFLPMYLAEEREALTKVLSIAGFTVQAVLIAALSVKFGRSGNSAGYSAFVLTLVFVTFNKVCTSQYFLWYLVLLPLAIAECRMTAFEGAGLAGLWLLGQGVWLRQAYNLEFKRVDSFNALFLSSILFVLINSFIISVFVSRRFITRKVKKE